METLNWWEVIGWVLFAGMAVLAFFWRKQGGDAGAYWTKLDTLQSQAKDAVQAAEQLWLSGQLQKDERYAWALYHLKKILPDLDDAALEVAVESAVFFLKRYFDKQAVEVSPAEVVTTDAVSTLQ